MGCAATHLGLRLGFATRGLYLAANDHLRLGGHAVPYGARRQPSQVAPLRGVSHSGWLSSNRRLYGSVYVPFLLWVTLCCLANRIVNILNLQRLHRCEFFECGGFFLLSSLYSDQHLCLSAHYLGIFSMSCTYFLKLYFTLRHAIKHTGIFRTDDLSGSSTS